MNNLQESWQRKLDGLFKDGVICTWMAGPSGNTKYNVAWVQVAGTSGLDPVLNFYVHGAPRMLNSLILTSWEIMRSKPHLIVKATFAGIPAPMMLTAAIPPELATVMASDRDAIKSGLEQET